MSDILVEVAEAVPVEVNLPAKDNAIEMEVYYQDEVSLDTDLSLFYIKSGEKEIENYVENVSKPDIANYTNEYAKPIVTQLVNDLAEPLVEEYIEGTVKPDIDTYTNEKLEVYNTNATSLTTAYTTNAATLLAEYNANATEKSDAFNTNASEKQALVDAGAATATAQAGIATTKANEASSSATAAKNSETAAATSASQSASSATASADSASASANSAALSKQYANDKINQTHITNCITEIPQDIKLELNNGVLTLKAGSKVYVPNGKNADGSLKFDVVVIESDRAIQNTSPTVGQRFIWVTLPSGYGNGVVQYCFSGTTSTMNSTKADTFSTFYNTETNKIYRGNGAAWEERPYSLPICLATNDATAKFTSIDQVFNGFGYIGSTVFALPNVKGLIPNGRNTDGSLKNIEARTNGVITYTDANTANKYYSFKSPVNGVWNGIDFKTDASLDTGSPTSNWYYDEESNYWMFRGNKSYNWLDFAHATRDTVAITSLQPKLPFRAADDQDVVKTSGDQTISGIKKFTSIIYPSDAVYLQSSKYNRADLPTTNGTFCNYEIRGKDGGWTGIFGVETYTDTRRCAKVQAMSPNGQYNAAIRVFVDNNAKAYTTCPAPASTSNANEIATTAWVRNQAVGFPNYSAAVSIADSTTSYTPPSNGIIQMGYLSAGDNSYSGGVTHSSGVDMVSQYSAYKYSNGGTFWCIVEKGVTYTLTSSQPNKKFIPFK